MSDCVYLLTYLENHTSELYQIHCVCLPVAVSRSASMAALRFVMYFRLWMTSCFHITDPVARRVYVYNDNVSTLPYRHLNAISKLTFSLILNWRHKRLCIPRRTLWRYTNVVLLLLLLYP